jgi:hypothetical protein
MKMAQTKIEWVQPDFLGSGGRPFQVVARGGTPSLTLAPHPIDGCPILRALCEGWDKQISPRNRQRQADLFLRSDGSLYRSPMP